MLDICLLGTGGMMPLPYRWLTSMAARCNGSGLLIDCGEGTQIALKKKGWSPKPIDIICFTHYHADHISGLPGFLLSMGNAERTEPVTLIGPRGLVRVVSALRMIAPELPFELKFIELDEAREHLEIGPYHIDAYKVNHRVTCYGYSITIPRKGKFDAERAKAQEIPLKFWNPLQKGNVCEEDGRVFTPDMVLGPPRKGISVTYTTDTRPTESIIRNAFLSDLFICEGMYGEDEKISAAMENRHMTFAEAAGIAKEAGVKELWLTHYSPAEQKPEEHIVNARRIFANSQPGYDGKHTELTFED